MILTISSQFHRLKTKKGGRISLLTVIPDWSPLAFEVSFVISGELSRTIILMHENLQKTASDGLNIFKHN
jgi:hypothetical protein